MDWWRRPLGALVSGQRVIVAGGPAAAWTSLVAALRDLGATDVLVVATQGLGAGPQPEAIIEVVDVPGDDDDEMVRIRAALDVLAALPTAAVEAIEAFDPDRTAVVFGVFLTETPELVGRPLVAHRRPEWVALEDKTIVDELLDRAGVTRAPSAVVPVGEAAQVWRALDHGAGTVWAADSRDGYHGGGDPHAMGHRRRRGGGRRRRSSRPGATPCGSCRSSRASPRRCTASCSPTASSRCGQSSW